MKVSIVGGSGYAGGELIRLLMQHPDVEIGQITSESFKGKYVHHVHPNLRKQQFVKFSGVDSLSDCDVLFLAMPHGSAMAGIDTFREKASGIIDLSADFRLRDSALYEKYYKQSHARPELLKEFVYGLPELHRERLRKATLVSGVGCNATSVILPLYPLFKEDLVDNVVAEAKVGSSEGGNKSSQASHHPERSGSVRSFAPTGHRHVAEMIQELGTDSLHFSATAIEMVRGVLSTSQCFLNKELTNLDMRKLYRTYYGEEPFVRIIKENTGIYRYPEPKILTGSNYCDIGFEIEGNRLVVIGAIDNLMKGAAGSAVQCMNIMHGLKETTGLEFPGLHPI